MQVEKYLLKVVGTQKVSLPAKAKILTVITINNKPWLFALVNPEAEIVDRTIKTFETGEKVLSSGRYIGTYIEVGGGTFTYHTFDEGSE